MEVEKSQLIGCSFFVCGESFDMDEVTFIPVESAPINEGEGTFLLTIHRDDPTTD